mmetsp:Transcript_52977/g.113625  ORF Transcript_52977/g.113625 Transcript_52977/m.113625 type:complete len:285 (-) Transcript_52977:672-1526(-)
MYRCIWCCACIPMRGCQLRLELRNPRSSGQRCLSQLLELCLQCAILVLLGAKQHLPFSAGLRRPLRRFALIHQLSFQGMDARHTSVTGRSHPALLLRISVQAPSNAVLCRCCPLGALPLSRLRALRTLRCRLGSGTIHRAILPVAGVMPVCGGLLPCVCLIVGHSNKPGRSSTETRRCFLCEWQIPTRHVSHRNGIPSWCGLGASLAARFQARTQPGLGRGPPQCAAALQCGLLIQAQVEPVLVRRTQQRLATTLLCRRVLAAATSFIVAPLLRRGRRSEVALA